MISKDTLNKQNQSEMFFIEAIIKNIREDEQKFREELKALNQGWYFHSWGIRKIRYGSSYTYIKIPKFYRFVDKNTKKKQVITFRNEYLKQNKYTPLEVKFRVIDGFKNNYSMRALSRNLNISRTAIKSILIKENEKIASEIKGAKIPEKTEKFIKEQQEKHNVLPVYIDIDDAYLKVFGKGNKSTKKRFRMLTFHLGINKNNEIVDKNCLIEVSNTNTKSMNLKELADTIKRNIKERYKTSKIKLFVMGDGAKWIKTISKHLKATYITDIFHILQKAISCFHYTKTKFRHNQKELKDLEELLGERIIDNIKSFIAIYDFKSLIDYLLEVVRMIEINENIVSKSKQQEITNFVSYLIKNDLDNDKYLNNKFYKGTHTETFVSHLLKKNVARKFTLFTLKTINMIFNLNINDNQNYNLIY